MSAADPTIVELYVAMGGDPAITDPTISQLYQAILALSAGAGGISWRGAWGVEVDYAQGDGVRHDGIAYVALAASTGSEPPSANWQRVLVQGPEGPAGPGGGASILLADPGVGWPGAETEVTVGQRYAVATAPVGAVAECIVAGVTGTEEPTFVDGSFAPIVDDGTATWVYIGLIGGIPPSLVMPMVAADAGLYAVAANGDANAPGSASVIGDGSANAEQTASVSGDGNAATSQSAAVSGDGNAYADGIATVSGDGNAYADHNAFVHGDGEAFLTTSAIVYGDGHNEIQRIESGGGSITGGTWDLTLPVGDPLTAIPWDVDDAGLAALINDLDVLVSGGPLASLAFTIEFSGVHGKQDLTQLTVDDANLTGIDPALSISTIHDGRADGVPIGTAVNGFLAKVLEHEISIIATATAAGVSLVATGLPTADPVVAGALWVDVTGILHVSAGA